MDSVGVHYMRPVLGWGGNNRPLVRCMLGSSEVVDYGGSDRVNRHGWTDRGGDRTRAFAEGIVSLGFSCGEVLLRFGAFVAFRMPKRDTYETLFFIVDLHAITLPYDAPQLSKATRSTAAIYLACGVDTSKGDENVGVALLTYPVLMASDILLYQVPEPLIPPAGARVMSLTDGLSKMSKSAPSDQSRINLLDPKDVIVNKIKRCKTDSFPGLEFDNPERPECNNLLSIYQLVTGKTKEEVAQECREMNWGTFKTNLADALIDHLHPIQMRYEEITSDPAYLDRILSDGATRAAEIADITLNNVYQAMGFLPR
ncbi:hypothetical protein QJS10_CPB18g01012 [Acorus calamus]|uniref:tryptophan--tRNA ligase n=1 Tax=Acorus calamus TaxID=4465 RepID=A0AAV9CMA4_ACOCL|nr:hypothetical protein QJS10_CPB18g01012 [Acorus calamus]